MIIKNYLLARDALTVKLFLPLALLAAKTLLPFGVDILSLKPCLFLFFLSDGWNVLLLISNIFSVKLYLIFSDRKDIKLFCCYKLIFQKNNFIRKFFKTLFLEALISNQYLCKKFLKNVQ